MSFIFARKYLDKINVLADNKVTVDPKDESFLIKNIGAEAYRKIKSLGIIKNVIINQNICVCSAGVVEDYNDLLKYIDNCKNISYDDICNKALEINVKTCNRTDFIVCTVENGMKIVQIKNYKKEETESAWIGSKDCFEKFQYIRFGADMNKKNIYDCERKKEMPLDVESIDLLSFSEVLKLNIDDTVGEILIQCSSVGNKFFYPEKLFTSISKSKVIETGKSLKIYDDVFDGGYTYYVYNSSNNYILYIDQLRCGVEYCPYIICEKYDHLRMPKFEYCDVDVFETKHNCGDYSIIMYV